MAKVKKSASFQTCRTERDDTPLKELPYTKKLLQLVEVLAFFSLNFPEFPINLSGSKIWLLLLKQGRHLRTTMSLGVSYTLL